MAHTQKIPIYGRLPPCASSYRTEEWHLRLRALRALRKIVDEDSDDEEDNIAAEKQVLSTSYNFVDYVRDREIGCKEPRCVSAEYGSRHILTHEIFKERSFYVPVTDMNKVFCSQWLSESQVVFGTKCNKLMVYDVETQKLVQIPSLQGRRDSVGGPHDQQCGMHSVQINPSKTLLATGARNSNEVAVYRLPTFEPVCVGEGAHQDRVFDMCWLDDQFLVSGSRDSRMALWRIEEDEFASNQEVPTYKHIKPLCSKQCKAAQKVRAVAFNKRARELAAVSLNGYIHIWNAETFKQKLSQKLPSCRKAVCLAVQDTGMYAVGCRSYTLLLDARILQAVKEIPTRYSGCYILSASFQGNVLTIGTGNGILMFYDLRAGKYLESSMNSSQTVVLKASKGWAVPDEHSDGFPHIMYTPAIYTHCYDSFGTRLFTAGGPLPSSLHGNYVGLWQ